MTIYETRLIKYDTSQYSPVSKLPFDIVKVNGEKVDIDIYKNNDDVIITFNKPLIEGDLLQIEYYTSDLKIFTKSRYGKGALYKLYSDLAKFKFNCKYKFNLELNEDDCFITEFSSKYNPFYSTVKTVRNDTGNLLDDISDDIISDIIFDNSLLVDDKLGEDTDLSEGIPLYIKNYVRYKTDLDLCYAIYVTKSGKLGSFKKKLSDLEVSNEIKLPDLENMLSRFKELIKPNESQLENSSGDASIASFVKAQATEYPVSARGVF